MVKSKIYTKGGDQGETSLVSGKRVSKSDQRIDLYGELDHLNSLVGLSLSEIKDESLKIYFEKIQNNLFIMGSNMACELELREKYKLPSLSENCLAEMEEMIDLLDKDLPKLSNFILPGGSRAAGMIHLCRTTCRGIERKMAQFEKDVENMPKYYLAYLNRLSDLFFVAARFVNHETGVLEKVWKS